MKMPKNSLYLQDWKNAARKDWHRVKLKLDSLLDEAIKYAPELRTFSDLYERVSGYYNYKN